MLINGVNISNETEAYLETAMWADGDDRDIYDCPIELLQQAEKDCTSFFEYLEEIGLYAKAREFADDDRIAHDFWLTRNGHGAGFWDGGYGSLGDALSKAAIRWGHFELSEYFDEPT